MNASCAALLARSNAARVSPRAPIASIPAWFSFWSFSSAVAASTSMRLDGLSGVFGRLADVRGMLSGPWLLRAECGPVGMGQGRYSPPTDPPRRSCPYLLRGMASLAEPVCRGIATSRWRSLPIWPSCDWYQPASASPRCRSMERACWPRRWRRRWRAASRASQPRQDANAGSRCVR